MKYFFLLFTTIISCTSVNAQFGAVNKDTTWKKVYRSTPERINDLVHTKLDVSFDYEKAWMYGKAWVTLQPHFYSTDSLALDAKGMQLNEVSLIKGTSKLKLQYKYDGQEIKIQLDKAYKGGEKYTIYIDYISKPNELETKGSAAITDAKGLYFINPKGAIKNAPIQIWTQGETEGTSVWCPIIDMPNQKTTQEIAMTVPDKYVSLSNGLLVNKKKNPNGTRTDTWKMDLPHAPYLFFMGVGDFAIIKDKPYKGKEVSYYVEKEQAPYAKGVFGNTPEMMEFFSKLLGVDFPWQKYAQIVGRDYVSGAMENTTATLHQESAYQNTRQLADGNAWEETVAHELFHQWFGDLVTAESWSNLTVNESFANYSEYLWNEYKYGKDAADEHNLQDMLGYVASGSANKHLVRFQYSDKEDMFDAVSYNKGGRILHMLRKYVGDEAFFKSLNNYLITNKFKAGEAGQLRLAFEEVTGKDMNWFFNQWYYGSGHPKLDINTSYNDSTKKIVVKINQTQKEDKVFQLPIAIDIYNGTAATRKNVWVDSKEASFEFDAVAKPSLINVDADKILLCEKKENKSTEEFVFQYKNAKNYMDRREALDYFAKNRLPEIALGLNDKYEGLRRHTIGKVGALSTKADYYIQLENLVKTEKDKRAKAAALKVLAKTADKKYETLYQANVADVSYSVAGASLDGLSQINPEGAYKLAKQYSGDAKGALGSVVNKLIIDNASEADFDYLTNKFFNAGLSQETFELLQSYTKYLSKIKDLGLVKKGVDEVIKFRGKIPEQFKSFTDPEIKRALSNVSKAHGTEIENYITEKMK
jgi:aminopeptidase N